MNIVYSSDFGDIEIGNDHRRRQAERLSRYAIVLKKFFEEKNLPKEHTTSTKDIDLKNLYMHSTEFRQIMGSGMYVSVGDRVCLYSPDLVKSGDDPDTLMVNPIINERPEDFCLTFAKDDQAAHYQEKMIYNYQQPNVSFVAEEPAPYGVTEFLHPKNAQELQRFGTFADNFSLSLRDVLPRSIAYTFKRKDIVRLYENCPEFAKIAESGRCFYYDGRIILFHPKCAKVGDDVHSLVISKAVYRHPSQYCLKVVTEADGKIIAGCYQIYEIPETARSMV